MATAATLINRALRLLGQIGSGEEGTSAELSDGLTALNQMVEGWRNDGQLSYAMQELTLTLSDGDGSYTIGPSGDVNTTRPVRIDRAWIVDNNISYPVRIIEEAEYAGIPDKTTESVWPDRLLYRPTMTTGTMVVYPVPNATRTMKLVVVVPVTEFAATSTAVSLPPGWERALSFNLAVEWASEFEMDAPPRVVAIARDSKAALKRMNARPIVADNEIGALFGARTGNIYTG